MVNRAVLFSSSVSQNYFRDSFVAHHKKALVVISDKFAETIKSFPQIFQTKGFFQFPLYPLASTEKIIKMSSHRSKVKNRRNKLNRIFRSFKASSLSTQIKQMKMMLDYLHFIWSVGYSVAVVAASPVSLFLCFIFPSFVPCLSKNAEANVDCKILINVD